MTNEHFAALHTGDEPLILFNIWDAGSARAVAEAGAKVIATGSHSLAGAQGFDDGEVIGFDRLLDTIKQIAGVTDLPLTVDFETGYADNSATLTRNANALLAAGAIGCNLEDRVNNSAELRPVAEQQARIRAVADAGLFVNARTDIFLSLLKAGEDPNRDALVDAALARAAAYREAGAGCFFAPGLSKPDLIERLCAQAGMPVNIIRLGDMVSNAELAGLGVSRISYGGAPWHHAMAHVSEAAKEACIL